MLAPEVHTREETQVEIAKALSRSVFRRRLYGAHHSLSATASRELWKLLRDPGSDRASSELLFSPDGYLLAADGTPIASGGPLAHVAILLDRRGCRGIRFLPDVRTSEIEALVTWLDDRSDQATPPKFRGIELLAEKATTHRDEKAEMQPSLVDRIPEMRTPALIYRTAARTLESAMQEARATHRVTLSEVADVSHYIAEEVQTSAMRALTPLAILREDIYTYDHSVNVALIVTALLEPFAGGRDELASVAQAALLHDIGKSRIPSAILHKVGRLEEDEFELIRLHPQYGAEILAASGNVSPLALEVAYCHHMRDGGLGYPTPRSDIRSGPVTAVIQVVDMFEALTAERPYKDRLDTRKAIDILLGTPGMGSKRAAINLLAARLSTTPPGSEVLLDTGERAIVIEPCRDAPERPLVRIVTDPEGRELDEPLLVDLKDAGQRRTVTEVVLRSKAAQAMAEGSVESEKGEGS